MEDFEDDIRISNATGELDSSMDEFLDDRFGTPETNQSASGIEGYLSDKFPSVGSLKREQTIPERFRELKKRR